jgi:hypothetical protein
LAGPQPDYSSDCSPDCRQIPFPFRETFLLEQTHRRASVVVLKAEAGIARFCDAMERYSHFLNAFARGRVRDPL